MEAGFASLRCVADREDRPGLLGRGAIGARIAAMTVVTAAMTAVTGARTAATVAPDPGCSARPGS